MAKISSSLCALGVISLTATIAQEPAPIAPPGVPPIPLAPVTLPVPASTASSVPAPIAPPVPVTPQLAAPPALPDNAPTLSPNVARALDFQGDEIGLVLRTLARQAGVTMIVSDKVAAPGNIVTARIENKTPLEAIEIIVESKGLIMEEKKGVVTVKTQEEKAKEPTESGNYTFSYGQAKDILPLLAGQLQSAVPPQFDPRTNTVYFRETKSNMDKIMLFLTSVDQPTRQVMIEARLVEVNANPKQSYGINWAGVVGGSTSPQVVRYGGSVNSVIGAPEASVVNLNNVAGNKGLNAVRIDPVTGKAAVNDFALGGSSGNFLNALAGQFAILSAPQLSATLRFLNEDADAEFLANPRIVTANNLKAKIEITRNQPVPELTFNEQTAQSVFKGFADKEFGNMLEVLPSINKDDFVTLSVKPVISNKVGDQAFVFNGATVTSPIIDKRSLESNVLIKSGDTLAIGGLLQDEALKSRTKVPVLGDIPVLGYMFQEKLAERRKRNLLIFVTPTIIRQGFGTGLEDQVSGLHHSGEEYADPNGWRNNAKGAYRLVPTSNRSVAADLPKPGSAPAPKKVRVRTQTVVVTEK